MKNQVNEQKAMDTSDKKTIKFLDLIFKGYEFDFIESDNKIHCWGAGLSGREIIKVNGNIVSEKRNMTNRHSLHSFTIGKHKYEVEFNVVSMMTGELHCILIKDDLHIETQKMAHASIVAKKPLTVKRFIRDILLFGLAGAILGASVAAYVKHSETPLDLLVRLFG